MKKHLLCCLFVYLSCTHFIHANSYQARILSFSVDKNSTTATTISNGIIAGYTTDTSTDARRDNAVFWQSSASSPQDLLPASYYGSRITSSHGLTLGGWVSTATTVGTPPLTRIIDSEQAAIWTGPSHEFVSLHPAGYDRSEVSACWGTQQVGFVTSPTSDPLMAIGQNAVLWNGTADSMVNLHPEGYYYSRSNGIYENRQVGYGSLSDALTIPTISHALLWTGTAESVIDLHPDEFVNSNATDVWGDQQVGFAGLQTDLAFPVSHAMLWHGSAETYVDLHPDSFLDSTAYAVCNGQQVGIGRYDLSFTSGHALLWSGTAESVLDLHPFLPDGYIRSCANDIDEFGNIIGTAMLADGTTHPVVWTVVPEPSTLLLLGIGAAILRKKRV